MVAACGISCCGFSSSWSGVELRVMRPVCRMLASYGDTLPHTVVGVCGEFQRTGRFLQRGI